MASNEILIYSSTYRAYLSVYVKSAFDVNSDSSIMIDMLSSPFYSNYVVHGYKKRNSLHLLKFKALTWGPLH